MELPELIWMVAGALLLSAGAIPLLLRLTRRMNSGDFGDWRYFHWFLIAMMIWVAGNVAIMAYLHEWVLLAINSVCLAFNYGITWQMHMRTGRSLYEHHAFRQIVKDNFPDEA